MSNAGVALDNPPDGELTRQHRVVSLIKTVKYLREAQLFMGISMHVFLARQLCWLISETYPGDIVAVGKLFQWCITRFVLGESAEIARVAEN
jgi:hypothetical protein